MRILITGSSGYLGRALVQAYGVHNFVIGLDPLASDTTSVVGSVADRELVRAIVADEKITAILHAGALHKPQVGTHSRRDFVDVNVIGTQNLLEAATEFGTVDRVVFTSTTSLMIDKQIRSGLRGGATQAAWLDETQAPLAPRNIYGVTKLAAEQLCRLHHELTGLPIVVLRTSRFFPEEDDQAARIAQSGHNSKVNELLFRRLTLRDCVKAHELALDRAPNLGFDTFIVSALSPFQPSDCDELLHDAPAVVARYFPTFRAAFDKLGWTMFSTIDRVYDARHAKQRLGFVAKTDFASVLAALESGVSADSLIDHDPSFRDPYVVAHNQ